MRCSAYGAANLDGLRRKLSVLCIRLSDYLRTRVGVARQFRPVEEQVPDSLPATAARVVTLVWC